MRTSKGKMKFGGITFPFLQGGYLVFSKEWYRFIGSQLAFTLFMSIWYTHIGKLIAEGIKSLMRWRDRGFSCKRGGTSRTLIEEDYEDLHTSTPFELSRRYANILIMVGLTFLYSSGIAILYPIAFTYFLLGYIIDKFLLVYVNRKPLMYDGELAKGTLSWFKWILAGHFFLGVFMFANEHIIWSKSMEGEKQPKYD